MKFQIVLLLTIAVSCKTGTTADPVKPNIVFIYAVDWAETNDLADAHPDIVEALSAKTAEWVSTLPGAPPQSCLSRERSQ